MGPFQVGIFYGSIILSLSKKAYSFTYILAMKSISPFIFFFQTAHTLQSFYKLGLQRRIHYKIEKSKWKF